MDNFLSLLSFFAFRIKFLRQFVQWKSNGKINSLYPVELFISKIFIFFLVKNRCEEKQFFKLVFLWVICILFIFYFIYFTLRYIYKISFIYHNK